jgi:hypothetical protein
MIQTNNLLKHTLKTRIQFSLLLGSCGLMHSYFDNKEKFPNLKIHYKVYIPPVLLWSCFGYSLPFLTSFIYCGITTVKVINNLKNTYDKWRNNVIDEYNK